MPGPHHDSTDSQQPFDPFRHRREIELMEQRFRERAERHGAASQTSGDIDQQVSTEMEQFFSESTQRLEVVVPLLDERAGQGMAETTGEIRRKIDDFFSQVKEQQSGSEPAVDEAELEARKARWTGMLAGGAERPSAAPPEASAGRAPPPRVGAASRPADPSARRPFGNPSSSGSSDGERPRMDLKTALERLKRPGVVKEGGSSPSSTATPARPETPRAEEPAARPPAPRTPFEPPPAPPAPESQVAPAAPLPPRRSEPSYSLPPLGFRPDEAKGASLPTPLRRSSDLPAPKTGPLLPLPEPDRRRTSRPGDRGRRSSDSGSLEVQSIPPERESRRRPAMPPRAARTRPPDVPPPVPDAPAPKREAGRSFDAIFSEVQDLVLDTLKNSVEETFDAARESEPEFGAVAAAEPAPAPARPARSAPPPARAGKLPAPEEEDESDAPEVEETPAAPYDWGVKKTPRPRGAWLVEDAEEAAAKPAAAEAHEPASGVGGRTYLQRKVGEEVQRLAPVVERLRSQGLIDERDLEEPGAAAAQDDSDEVSVESFADAPAVDLEAELSPTKLVLELRRLKRLTEALVRKGVLSEEDLERAPAED